MKEWHYFDKVYRVWVVFVSGDLKHFKKFLSENVLYKDEYSWLDNAGGCTMKIDKNNSFGEFDCYVVWNRKQRDMPTWVHELSHLIIMIFDRCSIEVSEVTTEPFAFLMERWYSEMSIGFKKYPHGRSYLEADKDRDAVIAESNQ